MEIIKEFLQTRQDRVESKVFDLMTTIKQSPNISVSGLKTKLDEIVLTSSGSIPWRAIYLPFTTSKIYSDVLEFNDRISWYIDNKEENRAPNSVGARYIIKGILENNKSEGAYLKPPSSFVFT